MATPGFDWFAGRCYFNAEVEVVAFSGDALVPLATTEKDTVNVTFDAFKCSGKIRANIIVSGYLSIVLAD